MQKDKNKIALSEEKCCNAATVSSGPKFQLSPHSGVWPRMGGLLCLKEHGEMGLVHLRAPEK